MTRCLPLMASRSGAMVSADMVACATEEEMVGAVFMTETSADDRGGTGRVALAYGGGARSSVVAPAPPPNDHSSALLARPSTPAPQAEAGGGRATTVDTLSDVLRAVRLNGAVFFDFEATSPWVAETPSSRQLTAFIRGAEHVIEYHVITRGECWGGVVGEEPVRLVAGDVIAFPHGDAHVLSSAPGMRAPAGAAFASTGDSIPFSAVVAHTAHPGAQLPFMLRAGGDEGRIGAHVVCGFLGCDTRPFNPLLAALPRMLHVRDRPGGDGGWLSHFIHVAL